MTDSNPIDANNYTNKYNSNYSYTNDYQTSTYSPKATALPGVPFAQSQAGRDGMYTISNQTSNYYPPETRQLGRSSSRVKT